MSAALQEPAPQAEAQPESQARKKRFGFGRKGKEPKQAKPPKPPKAKKPRRPLGIAPVLLLFALLTGAGAVAVLYYPIPGLTVKPPAEPEPKPPEKPSPSDALLKREAGVAQKEAELAAREAELKEKELQVGRLVRELGVTESESATFLRTAKLYVAMAPYKAAPLMAQLDDTTAVQVLRLMTADEAAAILSAMEPDRGARIMRELAKPPTTNGTGG